MSHILPNEAKFLYVTSFKRQGHKAKINNKQINKEGTRQRVKIALLREQQKKKSIILYVYLTNLKAGIAQTNSRLALNASQTKVITVME